MNRNHFAKPRMLILGLLTICLNTAFQPALAGEGVSGDVEKARQAWDLIDSGALVIDVRTTKEYADGHLPEAVNVPHEQIEKMVRVIGPDTSRSVVLYCGSGRRAGLALAALQKHGYTGLFNGTGLEALQATRPEASEP